MPPLSKVTRWPTVGEVGEQRALFVVGEDLGADRDLDDEVVAARPGAVRAGTTLAARGAEMLRVAKVDQRIEARDRLEDDVAALAAVAAVGAAELDELLAPETDARRGRRRPTSRRSWPGRGNALPGRVRRALQSWPVSAMLSRCPAAPTASRKWLSGELYPARLWLTLEPRYEFGAGRRDHDRRARRASPGQGDRSL